MQVLSCKVFYNLFFREFIPQGGGDFVTSILVDCRSVNLSICIKSNVSQLVLLVLQIHLHQALQLRVIRQVCLTGVADICIRTKKPQLVINEYNSVVLNVGSDWIVMYGSLGGV